MKKILILFLFLSFLNCENELTPNSNPIVIDSCFSDELGMTESEQFFYNVQTGALIVNVNNNITSQNLGYSLEEGTKTVFIYRHILENGFNVDDDEVEVRILFQIDENLNSFNISSSDDFENSNCIYGECGIALQSITGNINGSKNADGNWSVNADLLIDRFNGLRTIVINEVFKF